MTYILTDIEGTTTPITFVHDVLFPYSAKHLPRFVKERADDVEVKRLLANVAETETSEGRKAPVTLDEHVAVLQGYIAADRKHPALKALQGMIWRAGYEEGAYVAQVYPDVPPRLAAWKEAGHTLGVYSSGSVEAQILLFAHTEHGDLTPLFSDYFDTAVGAKKEVSSYETIARKLGREPKTICFLSDVEAELDAARAAGFETIQLVRPGTTPSSKHRTATDFDEVHALLFGSH